MDSSGNLMLFTILCRIGLCFVLGYFFHYMYQYWINGDRYRKMAESSDKIVIVTGASKGIGKEIAYGLAQRGLHVIMACRNSKDGLRAQNEIIEKTGNQNVKYMHLNLSSFKSIRHFANEFLNTGSRLDILINNTHILHSKHERTEDGVEQNIGVNYFGHFLLTMLLIERMSQTTPTRIINTTNWMHRLVDIDQSDLMNERQFCGFMAYARSALANVYFTLALSERIENTGITCNCVHTGISLANFLDHQKFSKYWMIPKSMLIWLAKLLCKSDEACADTTIFAAIEISVQNVSGIFVSNSEIGQIGDNSKNRELAEWLWKKSEEVTGETLCDLPNNFKYLKNQSNYNNFYN